MGSPVNVKDDCPPKIPTGAPSKEAKVHPAKVLESLAQRWQLSVTDAAFAAQMDGQDKLRLLRQRFHYMTNAQLPNADLSLVEPNEECVYFCSNSLGLQPKATKDKVTRELDKWATIGVYGHTTGELPWAHCDEVIDASMARIVGAKRSEVAMMNGLTVNEHLLLISFYRPTAQRHKILIEEHAFPSDHYCIESHMRLHGYNPDTSMILMKPRDGEITLRTEDIVERIEKDGDEIAVVLFSGVQYYTGQLFNIEAITKAGQQKGCYVGWDLAHAAGNVPLYMDDWGVDFACWCSYKYLCSGAGCIAGFYINERHFNNEFPKLHGWWSHHIASRFLMDNNLQLDEGARAYRISNPPMLLCASVEASMDVFNQTTMEELRDKSLLLTGYLELLIMHYYGPGRSSHVTVTVITPSDPEQRGAQLSLQFSVPIAEVFRQLVRRACVVDERQPNVIRVAPAPIYNSFSDVHRFVRLLGEALSAAGCDDK